MSEKGKLFLALGFIILVGLGWFLVKSLPSKNFLSPLGLGQRAVDERPLDKFTYENLRKRTYQGSEIKFDRVLKQTSDYTTWLFFFESDEKRISGAANVPSKIDTFPKGTRSFDFAQDYPVIIMIHGFAEQKGYYSGFGTERVAGELATNGYVTLAPDFAGYGESDKASADDFADRFETYTTTLNLMASVEKYCHPERSEGSRASSSGNSNKLRDPSMLSTSSQVSQDDNCRIGIWGHSNGGQIALSVLEISGKSIPTVLWNPVSKFFPYNILYYTDQFDDHGKWLRGALAKFEQKYDADKYSLDKFWPWIKAPILLQQGGEDREVPKFWSDELKAVLEKEATESAVTYRVYPGADHNMTPGWGQAVQDLLLFYKREL